MLAAFGMPKATFGVPKIQVSPILYSYQSSSDLHEKRTA
jgi:hypothetical protein